MTDDALTRGDDLALVAAAGAVLAERTQARNAAAADLRDAIRTAAAHGIPVSMLARVAGVTRVTATRYTA